MGHHKDRSLDRKVDRGVCDSIMARGWSCRDSVASGLIENDPVFPPVHH